MCVGRVTHSHTHTEHPLAGRDGNQCPGEGSQIQQHRKEALVAAIMVMVMVVVGEEGVTNKFGTRLLTGRTERRGEKEVSHKYIIVSALVVVATAKNARTDSEN